MANSSVIKPTWLHCPNPVNTLFQKKPLFTPLTFSTKPFHAASSSSSPSSKPRVFTVTCSNGGPEQSFNLKDALAGAVDERVEELLNREENKVLLDGLKKASMRVEAAKRELAEIERQELEAKKMREYINQLESRASEIAECQKEISEARAMVEEAERSLSQSEDGESYGEGDAEINKDEERLESVKAASISAIVGTFAGLPISLTQVSSSSQLILPVAITFVSCALFGVTYRYTIRRDLDDAHLKSGAWAAFGVVKGLAALGAGQPLALNIESFLSHAFDGAIYVSENLLVFVFAAVGLDYCFKARLLSPFPIKRSISRTKDR
ncbi:homer protein [Parasponia andersonii]|uniref:Homer protein n=1 Tax=Parasponia andersonii TaxID=3476 RepID=A0A2P5DJW5_PARAD|nr:homer protein [Parasponia andersonii]